LLLQDADKDETFRRSAEVYINYGQAEVNKIYAYITDFDREDLQFFRIRK
jgi:hypothetical protein